MISKQLYIIIFSISFFCCNLNSQIITLSDSTQISLLTNSSDNEDVYRLFGHTAIRVNDKANNIDLVFNYGIFDFDSPNFIYRFAKGETDYIVAGYSFNTYLFEYEYRKISVFEQIFNLSISEKQKIWDALCINSLPQNRKYRYNFFFDNCSTRPRDIIEKNVAGTINYTQTNKYQTFRDLVHECVNKEPWVRFGIDIVIGNGADKEITDRQKMYIPLYLENSYHKSTITSNDNITKDFISSEKHILDFRQNKPFLSSSVIDYPLIAGCALLLITFLFSILNIKKRFLFTGKIFDAFLFLIFGIAGCIIAFLMFVSEHPCTNPNWNLVWLNPIQLIVAFLFIPKTFSKCIYWYHFINFVLLSIFLLCWTIIPQNLEIAFVPFVLSLFVRSGTNIVKSKRMENVTKKIN